ncbi:hypothetical protein BDW02DRAFT_573383 [Decorospora gaudefroyi]|uniref:Uncharacterized protein n=1 Tax=Decorospora gaudefroyi TaxID=184978 RepID=A0A6A5K1F5_9PLEO|nr:hypothetical protein BDW02DRAFT_573383 [Decorospora gaudefroyi]
MRTHASPFHRLPLEVRNEIYSHVVPNIPTLSIPANSSALSYIRTQIPECLQPNAQIAEEAAKAILHRTLLSVEVVKIVSVDDLVCDVPEGMLLKGVRKLQITTLQTQYTRRSPLHDLIIRCPNLQVLKIPIPRAILFTSEDTSCLKTVLELVSTTGLHLLFTHTSLKLLKLRCPTSLDSYDTPDYREFLPLAKWLRDEAGGRVDVDINITPNRRYNERSVECSRCRKGCIRWIKWMDYFG